MLPMVRADGSDRGCGRSAREDRRGLRSLRAPPGRVRSDIPAPLGLAELVEGHPPAVVGRADLDAGGGHGASAPSRVPCRASRTISRYELCLRVLGLDDPQAEHASQRYPTSCPRRSIQPGSRRPIRPQAMTPDNSHDHAGLDPGRNRTHRKEGPQYECVVKGSSNRRPVALRPGGNRPGSSV